MIKIEMENSKTMTFELDAKAAPKTVANFEKLVKEGFYDGLIFHRVIRGFMIQGGDPQGSGFGGSDENIAGEFKNNGYDNPISHKRGVISMARAMHPDSAGSQFFIMHKAAPHLDGGYAAFGKLIDGFEELDRIATVRTGMADRPVEEEAIDKMIVSLNGYELVPPETIR